MSPQLLLLIVTLSVMTCLPPNIELSLYQSITANYSCSISNYNEENNICIKGNFLGVPSCGDNSVYIYQYNPSYDSYSLVQVLNSTFSNAYFSASSTPRSCAFASSFDIYIGFYTKNQEGNVVRFPYNSATSAWISSNSELLSVPGGAGAKGQFGYRIYDLGNDYFMIQSPQYTVTNPYTGTLQLVYYNGITNVVSLISNIGYTFDYTLSQGPTDLYALYGGGSESQTQYNAYSYTTSTITSESNMNVYPYAVYPSSGGKPVPFNGITQLNSTNMAVRLIDIYSNITLYEDTSEYVGQIDILNYEGSSWVNSTSIYEAPPANFDSNYYYNYGYRLASNQTILMYTTGANEIKFAQYDGVQATILYTYNANQSVGCYGNPTTTCRAFPILMSGNLIFMSNTNGIAIYYVNYTCDSGYRLYANLTCFDINECAEGTDECSPLRACVNTPGSYNCQNCPSGYNNNGSYGCSDIDECTLGTDLCVNRTCVNTIGSYYCMNDCPTGYTVSGNYSCVDINECASNATNNCSQSPVRQCVNTPGSYYCDNCPSGYSNNGPYNCVVNSAATGYATSSGSEQGSSNGGTSSGQNLYSSVSGTVKTTAETHKDNGLVLIVCVLYLIVVLL